jgi:hypothetical protein
LPRLEILNVSECDNLVDNDFRVISEVQTLDQLYLSYTNVKASTVVDIGTSLELLVLDASGIIMTVEQCDKILNMEMHYIQVSFDSNESERSINQLKDRWIDCDIKTLNVQRQ